jgi:hypothetical protein
VLGLGVVASVWWLVRVHGPRELVEKRKAASLVGSAVVTNGDPVGTVTRLAARHDPAAVSELIQIYGRWAAASDMPGALEARKLALQALLSHPSVDIGLQAVLAAVEMDQTPRQQDPMWPYLVHGVASLWDAVTITRGRDLAMIETRTKPREVLIESLTEVRPEKLTDEQRAQLVSDLIDLYPSLKPEQKPSVDKALNVLGGADLVEILAGRGLGQESHLKTAVDERRALEAASPAVRSAAAAAEAQDQKPAN